MKKRRKEKTACNAGASRGQTIEGALGPYALSRGVLAVPLLCIRGYLKSRWRTQGSLIRMKQECTCFPALLRVVSDTDASPGMVMPAMSDHSNLKRRDTTPEITYPSF